MSTSCLISLMAADKGADQASASLSPAATTWSDLTPTTHQASQLSVEETHSNCSDNSSLCELRAITDGLQEENHYCKQSWDQVSTDNERRTCGDSLASSISSFGDLEEACVDGSSCAGMSASDAFAGSSFTLDEWESFAASPYRRQVSVPTAPLRQSIFCMAAGHVGSVKPGPDGYVLKVYDKHEALFYEKLMESQDKLARFIPRFSGEVTVQHSDGPEEEGNFIKLSNLLSNCIGNASVMDCKLGTRSYLEEEVKSAKPRADLYQKLVAIDPDLPTPLERKTGACTKYRYMSANDRYTCLETIGYRIEGIVKNADTSVPKAVLKTSRTLNEKAVAIIEHFLPSSDHRKETCRKFLSQLEDMRQTFASSELAKKQEFIGTSLLFVTDALGNANVHLIDFAKTKAVPEGVTVDHVSDWKANNREDGLLLGLDNMIATWKEIEGLLTALDLAA